MKTRRRKRTRSHLAKAPSLAKSMAADFKTPYVPMSDSKKIDIVAIYTDDILAKLSMAFFETVRKENWGKRDLSRISGINETQIGHILAGRRKNLTAEVIALLSRSMRKRPELQLHDVRPRGNMLPSINDVVVSEPRQALGQATHVVPPSATHSTAMRELRANLVVMSAEEHREVPVKSLADIESVRQQPNAALALSN